MARDGMGLKLGVNIDHVATLRQARGTPYPDPVEAAALCEKGGAHGVTVHLREDRRHIQDRDVYALRKALKVRLNLEMAHSPKIVRIALDVRPDEVCLVPEKREELTTEGGLDVVGQRRALGRTVRKLADAGIVVSLFVDPDFPQVEAASALEASYVELHTGAYCTVFDAGLQGEAECELERLRQAARAAHRLGLRVNAGHGINMGNVAGILTIPHLDTLNIGHSIVSQALSVGLQAAVREMLDKMAEYRADS